jgi:hypothetical protein
LPPASVRGRSPAVHPDLAIFAPWCELGSLTRRWPVEAPVFVHVIGVIPPDTWPAIEVIPLDAWRPAI